MKYKRLFTFSKFAAPMDPLASTTNARSTGCKQREDALGAVVVAVSLVAVGVVVFVVVTAVGIAVVVAVIVVSAVAVGDVVVGGAVALAVDVVAIDVVIVVGMTGVAVVVVVEVVADVSAVDAPQGMWNWSLNSSLAKMSKLVAVNTCSVGGFDTMLSSSALKDPEEAPVPTP